MTLVCRLAVGPSQLSNALGTAGTFPGGKAAVIRGAVYRLKNLWKSSEANATKWFLHLRNQAEVTRAST